MASCFNCAYRERLITEEPCLGCLYGINWEPDEEQEAEDENISLVVKSETTS